MSQGRITTEGQGTLTTPEPSLGKKVVQTVVFTSTFCIFGMIRGQEGVVFLDLLLLTNSDIGHGSLILTASSVGFVIGILFIGILFDEVSNDFLFFTCVLLTAIMMFVIPWCRNLPLMVAMVGLRSLFMGPAYSGCAVVCTKVWLYNAGPFLQNLQFMFAVGGLISPPITEPFLSKQPYGNPSQFTVENVTHPSVKVTVQPEQDAFAKLLVFSHGSSVDVSVHRPMPTVLPESRVYIGMFIPGSALLIICLAMALKILFYSNGDFDRFEENGPISDEMRRPCDALASLHMGLRILCYALLALNCFSYGCVSKSMINYLMAFTVKYLGWSKTQGSISSTVFWSGFAIGRFLGVFLVKVLRPRTLLYINYIGLLATCLAMLFVDSHVQSPYLWWLMFVSSPLFLGSVFANKVSWLDTTVTPITGKLMSFLYTWDFLGTTTHMPLLGYLFEEFSPLWFLYLLCIHASLLLLTQASIDLCLTTKGFRCLSWPEENSPTLYAQRPNTPRRKTENTKLIQGET